LWNFNSSTDCINFEWTFSDLQASVGNYSRLSNVTSFDTTSRLTHVNDTFGWQFELAGQSAYSNEGQVLYIEDDYGFRNFTFNFYYCASKLAEYGQPIVFNYLFPDVIEETEIVNQSIRPVLTLLNFTDPFEEDITSCYPYISGLDSEFDDDSSFLFSENVTFVKDDSVS